MALQTCNFGNPKNLGKELRQIFLMTVIFNIIHLNYGRKNCVVEDKKTQFISEVTSPFLELHGIELYSKNMEKNHCPGSDLTNIFCKWSKHKYFQSCGLYGL